MKLCLSFIYISLFVINGISAQIKTIYSISEAVQILNNIDSNSLVVFDIDQTLISPDDDIFDLYTCVDYLEKIKDIDVREYVWSLGLKLAQYKVMDPSVCGLIKDLQKRSIKVIACTHMWVGRYGAISSIQDWRIHHLDKLDINFRVNNPNSFSLTNFSQYRENYPLFMDGVLFTNMIHEKGLVLDSFLKFINWTPSNVYFFDDMHDNIESVSKHMSKLNIPVYGYHCLNQY